MAAAPPTTEAVRRGNLRVTPLIQCERNTRRGGYDCQFVSPPPEAFQAECPVCLQILKQPCVISCPCGQKICRECVEQIKKDKKPCPLCNKTEITSFIRDYGLERYLIERDVHCSKKTLGCLWKGKLRDFEQHLNENPSPEEQLTGCWFVEIECKHGCGEWYERCFIDKHQNEECPKRPYSCKYCKEYDSTFEDIIGMHNAVCGKYPVTCPNHCQADPFQRNKIEYHLNDECPLTEVSCPFAYAGCEVKLPRKDMPGHMAGISLHFVLLASFTQEIDQKQRTMEKYNNVLEKKLRATEKQCQVQQEKLKATEKEIATLKEEMQLLLTTLEGFPNTFGVIFKKEGIYLPPFLNSKYGSGLCLCVYPYGFSDGEGIHVSVFMYLLQGSFDDQLEFRVSVTVQIVNQAGDHSHIEKCIIWIDDQNAGGVISEENNILLRGCSKFLSHADLSYNAAKNTQYLKNNVIIVRVVRVKLPQ